MEVVDVIEAFKDRLTWNTANAIKYILRDKGQRESDLAKAANYLHRERTGEWLVEDSPTYSRKDNR